MKLISDPTFLISTILGVLSIVITVWLGFKQSIQLPIGYTTLAEDRLEESEDDIKEELGQIIPKELLKHFYFITFRIWNSGRVSIELLDRAKPLIIAFKKGLTVFDDEIIETNPDELQCTVKREAEKILLTFPLLDPGESITLRILVSEYPNYLPAVYARIPGKKRIVRANNIRYSREATIMGIFCICAAIYFYMFSRFGPPPLNSDAAFPFRAFPILSFGGGIVFLLISWIDRRMPPHWHMPPLTMVFTTLLLSLPIAAVLGSLAAIIYVLFGTRGVILAYILFLFLITPLGWWNMCYIGATKLLKKIGKKYNRFLVCIVTGIIPLAMLGLFLYFYFSMFLPL